MKSLKSFLIWGIVVLVGLASFTTLALSRGEQVSAIWMVTAAISVYCIAYRFYSLYIANRVMQLDPNRLTPAERHNDGLDYVPTHKGVLFGHHFAAIAGAGPLVLYWQRKWVICPVLCGLSSAWCLPVPYRI